MSDVNPATVEVLTRVDMQTMKAAMAAQKLSLIRMSDGKHPTAPELELIKRASPDDFRASADHMQRHADLEWERHQRRMKLTEMVIAHSRHDSETTETIVSRMTPEDQKKFFELAEAFL